MFHLRINQVVGFTSKMFEKRQWKSDIISKVAGHGTSNISLTIVANYLYWLVAVQRLRDKVCRCKNNSHTVEWS